ncbi:uncharacterized protein [Macrobrachium rosenbergii]|uniref:uncharacterized protein n=1 Tax=Macrobrachium rosenbergii TaxID=79674 RepID=UPI0034D659F9
MSNIHRKVCRTWLRIRNSYADVISDGVRDLSIKNTRVTMIKLIQQKDFSAKNSFIASIESLNWEGYPCEILNTTIKFIKQVVAGGDWWVIDSHIASVVTNGIFFMASELDITNSSIFTVAPHGLRIMSGTATLSNVNIKHLSRSAIMVESPAALLLLNNVVIFSADEHCIVVPDRERISIKNVIVEGVPMNLSSPYLKFEDDLIVPANVSKVQLKDKVLACTYTSSSCICDFSNSKEIAVLDFANMKQFHDIQIKNAKALQILSVGCGVRLELTSVNGTFPHHTSELDQVMVNSSSEGHTKNSEPCTMSVSSVSSQLGVIYGNYFSNLTVNNSTVKRLHDGALPVFDTHNITVNTMDSIVITGNGSSWTRMKVGIMLNTTLMAPVKAVDVRVNSKLRKGALIVDHPNATTEFSKLWVSIVQKEGIIIKRGKLVLKDFRFSELLEGAIYVEEGASIEIDTITGMPDYASISVATRNQVVLKGISNWYAERMIQRRHFPPPPDMGSNLTINNAHESPFCRKFNISFSYRECDFSSVKNASVVVDLENVDQTYQTLEIRNASFVKLYPSCVRKLYLVDVAEATTVSNFKDCETWLVADGVHFRNIVFGVHDVTLTSCRVDIFAPLRLLKDLDLENTYIERLVSAHWTGYMGVFNNSYFGKVQGLVASSFIFVLNTTVSEILPHGVMVLADGLIVNSTIHSVAMKGIIVRGGLRIANVTIGSLAKEAITVQDGVLVLSNVTIGSSEEESILATMNGAVAMQNVTVGGKKVHWRGYIADSLLPNGASLVFMNRYVDWDKRKKNDSSSTTEQTTGMTSQSTTMTEPQPVTESNREIPLGHSEVTDSRQIYLSSSPWKWVGVSLSVFLVILLGCCIILAVTLVKTNNGRMLPVVFWRVMDDQNGLVAEDQPSPNFNRATRNSGYQPMAAPSYDM